MIESGQGSRLLLKTRETFGMVRQGRWEDLERDVASEPGVGGPIHFTHAALAQLVDDAIVAERQPDHLEVLMHAVDKGTPLSYSTAGGRLKSDEEAIGRRPLHPGGHGGKTH